MRLDTKNMGSNWNQSATYNLHYEAITNLQNNVIMMLIKGEGVDSVTFSDPATI